MKCLCDWCERSKCHCDTLHFIQEELGDIGQDLGLGAPAQTEDVLAPANEEEDVSVYFIFLFYSLLFSFSSTKY